MSEATKELLEVTETLLKWIIGERQCVYEHCSDQYGNVEFGTDREILAEYDEVINKAQAVINKVKLEAK